MSATLIKDPEDSTLGIENLLNDEEKTNFNIDSLIEVKEDLAFDIDPVGEITEYSRCPEINVSLINNYTHVLRVKDNTPFFSKPYPVPIHYREKVEKEINKIK